MFLDAESQLSDAQALTVTAVSTNIIDLGVDRDIGTGNPVALVVYVTVAADFTTTDETYQWIVQTDDNTGFSSATNLLSTAAINGDELPAGTKIVIPLGQKNERYLRLSNVLAGTTPTITIDAFMQPMDMIDGTTDYPTSYTIT